MRQAIVTMAVSGCAAIGGCATQTSPTYTASDVKVATATDKAAGTSLVTKTSRFEIHADPWLSLHHLAFHYARNDSGLRVRGYTPLTHDDLDAFTPDVVAAFEPVAKAYEPYYEMSLLRSAPLRYSSVAIVMGGVDSLEDPALKQALIDVMPVYKTHFWDRHEAAAQRLIDSFSADLHHHGDDMARRLTDYLESDWSSEPMRVDIVPYASWAGAYTGTRPVNHLTIGALQDMALDSSFETLFHEASHASPMSDQLDAAEKAAFAASGLDMNRYWHALLWYASGRAAMETLGEPYQPIYVTSGRLTDPKWGPVYQSLDAVWDEHDTLQARAIAAAKRVVALQAGTPEENRSD
ncbi:hypothetical protein GCM10007854_11810 [Algimonas porphyrae]|uniref:DUF4932 domain-containing protein n=1 Tax=Algimonas porphyrae TaxID=1128113 RepID=A0ABQ5V0T7_9PROT|nr:hypothetical protein GCM10007854_11810 [Algimonas porphyrae]